MPSIHWPTPSTRPSRVSPDHELRQLQRICILFLLSEFNTSDVQYENIKFHDKVFSLVNKTSFDGVTVSFDIDWSAVVYRRNSQRLPLIA